MRCNSTEFPTIREMARSGPLSEYTLRLMLAQGRLPGVFVGASGRTFRVNRAQLLDQLDRESREAVSEQHGRS